MVVLTGWPQGGVPLYHNVWKCLVISFSSWNFWNFQFKGTLLRYKCNITFYCHSCQCNTGYEGSGLQCTEIDPCSKPSYGGCHHEAICTKTGPGSNNCSCDVGFRGDGFVCVAIDPCMEQDSGNCHSNADCQYIGPGQVSI